ncbi:MAG TPA: ABC transporter permease [Patescibacteria group bacterium]|nr:ABC transporter permease [Patescibacteria group bacterium]
MNHYFQRINNVFIEAAGILTLMVLWELGPRAGWLDTQFFPPLSNVLLALWKLALNGVLFIHICASLQRIFIGVGLAVAVAVPLGFLLELVFPSLARKLTPLFRLFEQVNPLALSVIFILFFGIGEITKIFIILWSIVWMILFSTMGGIRYVNPLYLKIARSYGADRWTVFRKVILPGAAPTIFTGIRAAATYAFFILIVAESMGAYHGLGRFIRTSTFGSCIVVAVFGMAMDYGLFWLETWLLPWKYGLMDREGQDQVK